MANSIHQDGTVTRLRQKVRKNPHISCYMRGCAYESCRSSTTECAVPFSVHWLLLRHPLYGSNFSQSDFFHQEFL
jgi:hypothetical protein